MILPQLSVIGSFARKLTPASRTFNHYALCIIKYLLGFVNKYSKSLYFILHSLTSVNKTKAKNRRSFAFVIKSLAFF